MFDYFDMKVVLTTPLAADRWRLTVNELSNLGMEFNVDYSAFIAIQESTPHRSFNASIYGVVSIFANSDNKRLLFMEDDVVFCNNTNDILRKAVSEIPSNWDVLYLGTNLHVDGFRKPVRYSDHLCRIYNAWTTHAVAFSAKCARWLAYNYPGPHVMFDAWLSDQLFHFNAYCVTPMIATQRPDHSNIWGHYVDYTGIFTESDKLLIQK